MLVNLVPNNSFGFKFHLCEASTPSPSDFSVAVSHSALIQPTNIQSNFELDQLKNLSTHLTVFKVQPSELLRMIRAVVSQHLQKAHKLVTLTVNINSQNARMSNINRHGHQDIKHLTTTFSVNEGLNPAKQSSTSQTNSLFGNSIKIKVKKGINNNNTFNSSKRTLIRTFHSSMRILSSLSPDEVKKEMQSLTDQFMEAKELLEDVVSIEHKVYICKT